MTPKKNLGKSIFTVCIIAFLAAGFVLNVGILAEPWKRFWKKTTDFTEWIDETKAAYPKEFALKEQFINLNGLFARITGRTVCNGVSVLNNGMLSYDTVADLDMTPLSTAITQFHRFLSEQEIPFLYVQAPAKSDLADSLVPYGVEHYGNRDADELLASLSQNGVSALDLRQALAATPESVGQYFYRTDHHWNTHGAFAAFGEALHYLQTAFPSKAFDMTLADVSNWEQTVYENWFLGSRGKRVGVCFGGVDDLVIYTPKFETKMSFTVPLHQISHSGSFEETLIRPEYLDKPNYFDESPYYAYIGGDYPLVHHTNELAANDLKILLIKDSFSIPFQAFLSTAVRKLDVIDPRYLTDTTVQDYITKERPDVVLWMLSPTMFSHPCYRITS